MRRGVDLCCRFFFFSSRRRHTRLQGDWSSDVCSSDLYETTGPEIWRDTEGRITHFVSSMGTTGTIMGCSRFFKEKNRKIEIIGCQPEEGSQIPGIRKWPEAYLPKIYDKKRVDRLEYVSQAQAEEMTRRLAREEGIFAGIPSGGPVHVA